jgi:dTDP-4-amino-4,6-dideoxygalactose transaminase
MKVPLLDLKAGYQPLKAELEAAVLEVMENQEFIMGPRVLALEAAIAKYVGVPHAISCANGSDALLLAMMALDIGPGDEVITTPYSFFATAGSIARLGARPVFVDIDPETYNIDASRIEAAITPRTRAILPVHLFGQCADMDAIMEIANRHKLPVIEDAAQAIGARWAGKNAGTFGLMGSFSFYPSKNLGAFGDGGILTTRDEAIAQKLRALRTHGGIKKYYHDYVGMNSRLDALQAAILLVKLPHLEKWHAARQHNACKYYALLGEARLLDVVDLPVQRLKASHVYNQFVIRVKDRDALQAFLKEKGVGTEVYYPRCLHEQPCFAGLGYKTGDFPHAEAAAAGSLAIPVFPEILDDQRRYVVSSIAEFYEGHPSRGGAA